MSRELNVPAETGLHSAPSYTLQEILQQPLLWPDTVESVRSAAEQIQLPIKLQLARVLLTGA